MRNDGWAYDLLRRLSPGGWRLLRSLRGTAWSRWVSFWKRCTTFRAYAFSFLLVGDIYYQSSDHIFITAWWAWTRSSKARSSSLLGERRAFSSLKDTLSLYFYRTSSRFACPPRTRHCGSMAKRLLKGPRGSCIHLLQWLALASLFWKFSCFSSFWTFPLNFTLPSLLSQKYRFRHLEGSLENSLV